MVRLSLSVCEILLFVYLRREQFVLFVLRHENLRSLRSEEVTE